jgi:hypothetical protein
MNTKFSTALLFCIAIFYSSFGQDQNSVEPKPKSTANTLDEMRLKLNEDGSHYLKWTFMNQVWFRYNQSNPGTTVMNDRTPQTFDIGLRRTRIQFYGQLTDHTFFYTQIGQNNFNYLAGQNSANNGNRKFQIFFHDALGEYKVWKDNDKLKLGGGLTITNGLSRFSQPSVGTIMTLDVPVFAQATVDQTDEFSRKLSVYARGQVGKFDYRVTVSDPFPVTSNGSAAPALGQYANFSQVGHHKQYQGFFIYNFFDKETHTTPYMQGTYLGKKKVLNLEAGVMTQRAATWSKEALATDTSFHTMTLWSVAAFYDAPLNTEKGTALNAYVGYFDYEYGPGYLRYNGIMNPANGVQAGYAPNTQGNAYPMFGSGNIFYAQVGYLMKKDLLGDGHGTLMPYASLLSAKYHRLDQQMNVIDVGVNWLIKGHGSKISLDYQNRPVYELQGSGEYRKTGNKGQVVLQYQLSI